MAARKTRVPFDVRDPAEWMNALAAGLLVLGLVTSLGTRRHPEWAGILGTVGDTDTFRVSTSLLVLVASLALWIGARVWRRRRRAATNAK